MWCPIIKTTCYPYDGCIFKKEDKSCLLVDAVKVYIKEHEIMKIQFDTTSEADVIGMFI